MAVRQLEPGKFSSRAASAALFVMASCFALPAAGATPHQTLCPEADSPNLEVPVEALTTETVNHDLSISEIDEHEPAADVAEARTQILEPRARTAIQEAFSEIEVVSDDVEADEVADEEVAPPVINTRLPGISEERMDRYKRQMYRRDI